MTQDHQGTDKATSKTTPNTQAGIIIKLEEPSARGRAVLEALTVVRKVTTTKPGEHFWYADGETPPSSVPQQWARVIPTARPKFLKRNAPVIQNDFVRRKRVPWK